MSERVKELMSDPRRGLMKLAWPVIVSMLFGTLLNFTDFFFVGGLGPNALAAVQLSFPLFFIIMAIGSGVSIGSTALIARRLGEGNKRWAEETALHALVLAVGLAVLTTTAAFFVGPLAGSLGGGPAVSKMARDYMQIIFAGSIIFFLAFSIESILRGEGDTKTPMKLSIVYTLTNIVLDPIFIYTFNMGVGGAALATIVSVMLSLSIYVWYVFISKRSHLQIHPREFIYTPRIMKNILKVGLPSAASQIALSIAVGGVNLILSGFGDGAISAYGIGFRVDSLAILPMLGLAAGLVSMIGYYRGAKDYKTAKRVNRIALKLVVVFGVAIGAAMFLLAGLLPWMFSNDAGVVQGAAEYLRVIAFAYPFIGIVIVTSSSFQGMGRGVPSLVLTMTRAVLLVLPLCYYLAYYTPLGTAGVSVGIMLSAVITSAMAFTWAERYFRSLCRTNYQKA